MSDISDSADQGLKHAFQNAELEGLKLALKGRALALIILGVWFIFTRSADLERSLMFAALFGGFFALGAVHHWLVGSHFDRPWLKFVMMSVDVLALSFIVATQPIFETIDVPQAMTYRNNGFPFYFVFLGVAAFTFSAWLVLWTGVIGAASWILGFAWATRDMVTRYDWGDMGTNPTTEHFYNIFFSPYFAPYGSRVQEATVLLVVAVLIAIVMQRARKIVHSQLELDQQQRFVSDMFGRYVPAPIVEALLKDKGALEPVERSATVLFADIANFTQMTESLGARKLVNVLNSYFDGVTQIISEHGGMITQFQGDAVLALFNVPLEEAASEAKALAAARALEQFVTGRDFEGEVIRIRVGISSGPVVAGNVGGGGRQTYTAHGNTVNMAARLEALNKEYGTTILLDEPTCQAIASDLPAPLAEITVRGRSQQTRIYNATDLN